MAEEEQQIQTECLNYLRKRGHFVWKNNNSRIKGKYFTKKGVSDILGIGKDGKFLAVEVKTDKGLLSPQQADFILKVKYHGGIGVVARSVEDLVKAGL